MNDPVQMLTGGITADPWTSQPYVMRRNVNMKPNTASPGQHCCKSIRTLTKIILLMPEGVEERLCHAREGEKKKWDQTSVFTSWSQSKHSSCVSSRNGAKRAKVLVTPLKDYKPWHFDICIHLNLPLTSTDRKLDSRHLCVRSKRKETSSSWGSPESW